MSIGKDISELIQAKVISQETADRIREYYRNKPGSRNRLPAVFGILGAMLVGLGLILIIAHNWDAMSRTTKTIFAFLPLLAGQALCGFVLLKKQDQIGWRESTTSFLFFAVGASISLVGQIYHIPGNTGALLLTWMSLAFPLIYIMKSHMVSLLYLAGITYYAVETGYWSYPTDPPFIYWVLLLMALPHYYGLFRDRPESNFTIFHHWIIPLSLTIVLGSFTDQARELMFVAYMSLFGIFYLLGNAAFFTERGRNNGYAFIGPAGTIVLLLVLSFDWFWQGLATEGLKFPGVLASPECIAAILLTLAAAGLLYGQKKEQRAPGSKLLDITFLLFIVLFLTGLASSTLALAGVNLLVLLIGTGYVTRGIKYDLVGALNYGLLIITALIVCRFFDTDLSFILRGILFVSLGTSFFLINYWLLKKRKTYE